MKLDHVPSIHLLPTLQDMIVEAALAACGEHEYVQTYLLTKSGGVIETPNTAWNFGSDFITKIAVSVYSRHVSVCMKLANQQEDSETTKDTIIPLIVGKDLYNRRAIHDAKELAQLIIDFIDEEKRQKVLAGVHIKWDGTIHLTTKQHLDWQSIHGKLSCPECGAFLKGIRGLRQHLKRDHKIDNLSATLTAHVHVGQQLVKYSAPSSTILQWATEECNRIETLHTRCNDEGLNCARFGQLEQLQNFISNGWDPHTVVDRNGSNALAWAAGEGHVAICRYLVETCGMDVNPETGKLKRKRRPLHWAARNGRIDVCSWLIFERGVDVNIGSEDGTTSLHYAAMTAEVDCCMWLVDTAGCDINQLNSFGCNASHWCSMVGSVPLMRFLTSRGVEYKHINNGGHSVLHKVNELAS